MSLPSDSNARKAYPIATGVIDYFPDALAEVARCSLVATQQHHPDEPLHWDRAKSPDEANCLIRHFVERGTVDTDGVRHSAKVAWRALALLQREIDAEKADAEKAGVLVYAVGSPDDPFLQREIDAEKVASHDTDLPEY